MFDDPVLSENCTAPAGVRKRVLVIAYAYSPTMGSEYRHAWELSHALAEHHDVTVLLGDSDGTMGSFQSLDAYLAKGVSDPVNAVKVVCSRTETRLAQLMLRPPFSLLFAALLRVWHRRALALAQQLHAVEPFDVVHQLGPIGFRNPGYGWKLGAPSYWGPIGGAQFINLKMVSRKFSFYFLEVNLRNVDVWLRRFSPYIRNAARHFDQLSFATPENRAYFHKYFGRDGIVISDQGLNESEHLADTAKHADGRLIVAWGGTLNARKNVDLLIAIANAVPDGIEFQIMGDGPLRADLEQAAKVNPRLRPMGLLPRAAVQDVLRNADVIMLTSLSEANTAILFEGMENGCVPVAPRINGFAACLDDSFAITYPYDIWDDTVSAAAAGLAQLRDGDALDQKRAALRSAIESLTWQALARKHLQHYG